MNFTTILIIFSNSIGILVSVLGLSEAFKQKKRKQKLDVLLILMFFSFGFGCLLSLFNLGG